MFERAWYGSRGMQIASYAGVAMPQPNTARFSGVLHLHGRLADPQPELDLAESDLVLTSAEFGNAYLRSGWASRYVYDLIRAHTLVLVGYEADDPPMRYLLEALEADRERYPDLHHVYAFAPCEVGEETKIEALWRAKGVNPIPYTVENDDHSLLYQSLREWQRYADDPTRWRQEQLRPLFAQDPADSNSETLECCASLLSHGDASQLLGELSPNAAWLPILAERRVLDEDNVRLGPWIAGRIHDKAMVRECAGLAPFDEETRWRIGQALEHADSAILPVVVKAWRLILIAQSRTRNHGLRYSWYRVLKSIEQRKIDHDIRSLVSAILKPELHVRKQFLLSNDFLDDDSTDSLVRLIRVEFEPQDHPSPDDILGIWPEEVHEEIALLKKLDRSLVDALEEAADAGVLNGFDHSDHDVPSIARHEQNAHHSGFYPITRTIADLWERIVAKDPAQARALALPWRDSNFTLQRRLFLFALSHEAFSAREAAEFILGVNDTIFWLSGGGRWNK